MVSWMSRTRAASEPLLAGGRGLPGHLALPPATGLGGSPGSKAAPFESEARYRDLVERLPLIVYIAGLDSGSSNLYISPQTTAILGFSPADWASDPDLFTKTVHADDRERVLAECAHTLLSGEPLLTDYRLVARDGRVVWIHDEGTLVRGEDGEPLYLQGYMIEITERMQRADAVKSAARSRAMLDAALDGIISINHEGTVLEFNPAAEQMFGYRREDALGKQLADLVIPPSHREAHTRGLRHYLATGEGRAIGKRIEISAMRADRSEFPIELSIVRVELPGPPVFTAHVRDISERKRVEETLLLNESRYRDLFENASDMIVSVDLEGNLTEANNAVADTLGYSSEELLRLNLSAILPRETQELARSQLARKLTDDVAVTTYEHDFVAKDGHRVPVEVKTRVRRVSGRPIGVEAIARDMSERNRLEERLREITALVDATEDAVIGTTPQGIITSWNRGAELIYGWTPDETVGRSLEMVVPEATRAAVSQALEKLALGGVTVIRQQARGLHRDGREIDVALTVCPVFAAGALVAVSTIARDISLAVAAEADRERLLHELEQQNDQLREFDRLKDEFVASVSHELRTPLTSIVGYLELFREGSVLDEEHDTMLRVIDRNAERLLDLVSDLLFAAQVAAGKPLVLNVDPVDLADIVAQAVTAAGPRAEQAGLTFDVLACPAVIQADNMRIAQVVDNLISNAIKFSGPGGKISIELRERADFVVLSVADTGIGIPVEDHPSLFSRFYRAKAATDGAIQGTGLGLAIVKAAVEAHGGEITFKSEVGVGTTFEVALPRGSASSNAA
jgi:PAS domain S-box-containing protein